MKNVLLKINSFFEGIPDWVIRRKVWIILGFAVLTIFAVIGANTVKVITSLEAVFQSGDKVKIAYDRFRAEFGSDEVLYIVYKAKDGDIFSRESLQAIAGIHNELSAFFDGKENYNPELEHITDITSIINVSYLEGKEGSLVSRNFIGDPSRLTAEERKKLRETALSHPDYPRVLVSDNGAYGAIMLRTDFNTQVIKKKSPGKNDQDQVEDDSAAFSFEEEGAGEEEELPKFRVPTMQEYIPFMNAVREITSKPEYAENLTFFFAGNPELMNFYAQVLASETYMILAGSLLLIMIVLAFLFRTGSGVVWPLLIVIFTLIWTMGTVGWSNIASTDTIMIIVFLLIAVGVADAIHILSGYLFYRRKGVEKQEALKSVYKKSGFACFLTSLTTMCGLLAMTVVPVPSMQVFGFFAALGVFYAFLITIIMLPVMLNAWAPLSDKALSRKKDAGIKKDPFIQRKLEGIAGFAIKYKPAIIVVFLISGLFLLSGVFFIEVDASLVNIIREDRPIRKVYNLIDNVMAGTGNVEILVDTGVADGHKNPVILKAINELQNRLEKKFPGIIRKTLSLANVTKDSYKAINEGQEAYYKIPEDPGKLAQTLVLFNSANPDDRRMFVTDDYRISRLTLNIVNLTSRDAITFMDEVKRTANDVFADASTVFPQLTITYTGQVPLVMQIMDKMSWSQIKSFAVTLAIISILLLLVFGSVKVGFISILPNIFPIVIIFGIMGYFKIPLDLHTLLVIPIIIGIAVDDTIHFITHFRIDYLKNGDAQLAVQKSMKEVGQAMIFTSITLAVGYLIFLLSTNKGFVYFGILSSAAIVSAIIADLILLPSLLLAFYSKRSPVKALKSEEVRVK